MSPRAAEVATKYVKLSTRVRRKHNKRQQKKNGPEKFEGGVQRGLSVSTSTVGREKMTSVAAGYLSVILYGMIVLLLLELNIAALGERSRVPWKSKRVQQQCCT